jgi:hypothetical protein
MGKRKMTLQTACEIVPDDLPDGAYWAMAHEISGAEYGEAWDELDSFPLDEFEKHKCPQCNRTFKGINQVNQHIASMVRNETHKQSS